MTGQPSRKSAVTRKAGGWHGGNPMTGLSACKLAATREAGGWHGGKDCLAGASREAGGWHGGKQWRRSRRQGAPVTGPAGRRANQ